MDKVVTTHQETEGKYLELEEKRIMLTKELEERRQENKKLRGGKLIFSMSFRCGLMQMM